MQVSAWPHLPPGCSTQAIDGTAHFNTHVTGVNKGGHTIICAVSTAATSTCNGDAAAICTTSVPPGGCSVQSGKNWTAHYNFNRFVTPRANAGYRSVCHAQRSPCSGYIVMQDKHNLQYNATVATGSVCYAKCVHGEKFYNMPHNWTVERKNVGKFTCSEAGVWEGELRCPNTFYPTTATGQDVWTYTWLLSDFIRNPLALQHSRNSDYKGSLYHFFTRVMELADRAGLALTVNEDSAQPFTPTGRSTSTCTWVRQDTLPGNGHWLAVDQRGDCTASDRTCSRGVPMNAQALTLSNLPVCYTSVWARNGHLYRVLPESHPFAGALQRAAQSEFCGIQGHMAVPETHEELQFLRRVIRGSGPPSRVLDWNRTFAVPDELAASAQDSDKNNATLNPGQEVENDAMVDRPGPQYAWLPLTVDGKLQTKSPLKAPRTPLDPFAVWHWADGVHAGAVVWNGTNQECVEWCQDRAGVDAVQGHVAVHFDAQCTECTKACRAFEYGPGLQTCRDCRFKNTNGGTCFHTLCSSHCGFMNGGRAVGNGSWSVPDPIFGPPGCGGSAIELPGCTRSLRHQVKHPCAVFQVDAQEFVWHTADAGVDMVPLPLSKTMYTEQLHTTVVEYDPAFVRLQQRHSGSGGGGMGVQWNACGPGALCDCYQFMLPVGNNGSRLIIRCDNRHLIGVPNFPASVPGQPYTELEVWLNGNNLTHIKDGHFDHIDSRLRVLRLEGNALTSVPVVAHAHLQHLDLRNNRITDGAAAEKALAALMVRSPSITDTSLDGNPFRNTAAPGQQTTGTGPGNTYRNVSNTSGTHEAASDTTEGEGVTIENTTARTSLAASSSSGVAAGAGVAVAVVLLLVIGCGVGIYARRRLHQRTAGAAVARDVTLTNRVKKLAWSEFIRKFGDTVLSEKTRQTQQLMRDQEQFGKLETPPSRVRKHGVQGKGAFGDRYFASLQTMAAATHRGDAMQVIASVCASQDVDAMTAFLMKAYLRCALKHRNILPMTAVVTRSLPMMVLTRHMTSDLKAYLRKCRPTADSPLEVLAPPQLMAIALSVAEGCEYLEKRKVIHRALQAQHILVGRDHREICISGLGSMRDVSKFDEYVKIPNANASAADEGLDVRWLAPELCLFSQTFSSRSDVWAFGILLWEIASYARLPFGQLHAAEIKDQIKQALHLAKPEGCTDGMYDVMSRCWRFDPMTRPTFASLRGSIKLLTMPECRSLLKTAWSVTHWKKQRQTDPGHGVTSSGAFLAGHELGTQNGPKIEMGAFTLTEYASTSTSTSTSTGGLLGLAASIPLDDAVVQTFNVLNSLKHPGVLSLLGYRATPPLVEVMMARGRSTSLHHRLQKDAPTWPQSKRTGLVLAIAEAVGYVHTRGFVHGVLSPHMFYVDHELAPKLIFHTAWTQRDKLDPLFVITHSHVFRFLAPEVAASRDLSSASDVYSVGVLLWQIYHPTVRPFAVFESREALVQHRRKDPGTALLPPLPEGTPDALVRVLSACCQADPPQRPSMMDVAAELCDEVKGFDRWNVPRDVLFNIETLGSGQFGEVNKMASKYFSPSGDFVFVAVKTLLEDDDEVDAENREQHLADFEQEIEMMKRVQHPHLVSLLGCCVDVPPLFMILEFSCGGSLEDWLPTNGPSLKLTELLSILHQVAMGLVALKAHQIVHRDIAARNVLIGEDLCVKVSDLGLSRDVSVEKEYYRMQTFARPLPLRWTPPEVLTTLQFTPASDVYSYGVLIFEVFSFGDFPFDRISDADFIKFLTTGTSLLA